MEVLAARVRTTQTDLFQPTGPEPAKLEITLARLRAVVGETDEEGRGLVGFPVVLDSHPDSFAVLPTYAPIPNNQQSQKSPDAPTLVMRIFRPAANARVEIRGNAPAVIAFNGTKGRVTHASGSWRSGGELWSTRRLAQKSADRK